MTAEQTNEQSIPDYTYVSRVVKIEFHKLCCKQKNYIIILLYHIIYCLYSILFNYNNNISKIIKHKL